jgi:hypothetical protein
MPPLVQMNVIVCRLDGHTILLRVMKFIYIISLNIRQMTYQISNKERKLNPVYILDLHFRVC